MMKEKGSSYEDKTSFLSNASEKAKHLPARCPARELRKFRGLGARDHDHPMPLASFGKPAELPMCPNCASRAMMRFSEVYCYMYSGVLSPAHHNAEMPTP
jgi:hypothetical protein